MSCVFYKRPSSTKDLHLYILLRWLIMPGIPSSIFLFFFCEGWEWPAFEALFTNLNGELLNILWNKKVKLSRW